MKLPNKLGDGAGSGVVIAAVATHRAAERAGLEPGMLILAANRYSVNSLGQLQAIVDPSDLANDGLRLLVRGNNGSSFVVLNE